MSGQAVLSKLLELRTRRPSKRVTLVVSIVAAIAVVVLSVVSIGSLELTWSEINQSAAVICILVGFFQIPLNAAEYRLSSRFAGAVVGWRDSIRTTAIASAANILPVPAGAAVRIQGLRRSGAGTGSSVAGTGAIATIWLAVSAAGSSIVLFTLGSPGPALGFTALFAVAASIAVLAIRSCQARDAKLVASTIALETVYVGFAALRFWLALRTINVDATASEVLVIASGSPVASAAGVVPGALGVLEGLAAGAAELVDLPGSSGFLSAALLRGFAFFTSGVALAWIGLEHLRPSRDLASQPPEPTDGERIK